jgi:mannan endo-1,4-beta-mannosidase
MLNGVPWRFAGANCYCLGLEDGDGLSSPSQILSTIQAMSSLGMNGIRWQVPVGSVGSSFSIEPTLGTFNSTTFANFDYVLQQLNIYGIKAIVTLVDWSDFSVYGGIATYLGWRGYTQSGQTTTNAQKAPFFTDATVINDFKLHIATVLNHVNTLTGIAYKDDPAILCWETGNEIAYGWNLTDPVWPSTDYGAPGGWLDQISTYIKVDLGAKQLVMDGYYGVYNGGATDTTRLALPNVDIYTEHTYDPGRNPTEIPVQANICATHGKAYVLGEYGVLDSEWAPQTGWHFTDMMTAVENSHAAGDTWWNFGGPTSGGVGGADSYYYPNTPQAAQIQAHTAVMAGWKTPY